MCTPGLSGMTVDIDGVVRWGSVEGTLEIREAALTNDGSEVQLCTTGLLDWTADRAGSRPVRPLSVPDDVTRVQIDRGATCG